MPATDFSRDSAVHVFDPTDDAGYDIPLGKQRKNPSHIFYTP